jgi:hypothetical protein
MKDSGDYTVNRVITDCFGCCTVEHKAQIQIRNVIARQHQSASLCLPDYQYMLNNAALDKRILKKYGITIHH